MASHHIGHGTSWATGHTPLLDLALPTLAPKRRPHPGQSSEPLRGLGQVFLGQRPRGSLGPGKDWGGGQSVSSLLPPSPSFSKCLQTKESTFWFLRELVTPQNIYVRLKALGPT